jgi:hypothetical protein
MLVSLRKDVCLAHIVAAPAYHSTRPGLSGGGGGRHRTVASVHVACLRGGEGLCGGGGGGGGG